MTCKYATSFIIIFTALLCLPIAVSSYRLSRAHTQLNNLQNQYNTVQQEVSEIYSLQNSNQQIAWGQRPTEDVLAQVNTALAESGIPAKHLRGIGEETDVALPSMQHTSGNNSSQIESLRRQTLTITLTDMNMAQLGEYFNHWHTIQDLWTINRIEMNHQQKQQQPQGSNRNTSNNSDSNNSSDSYTVRLQISVIYLADS